MLRHGICAFSTGEGSASAGEPLASGLVVSSVLRHMPLPTSARGEGAGCAATPSRCRSRLRASVSSCFAFSERASAGRSGAVRGACRVTRFPEASAVQRDVRGGTLARRHPPPWTCPRVAHTMVTVEEAKKLTVPKLKAELTALGLSTDGLKAALLARLLEAITAAAAPPAEAAPPRRSWPPRQRASPGTGTAFGTAAGGAAGSAARVGAAVGAEIGAGVGAGVGAGFGAEVGLLGAT